MRASFKANKEKKLKDENGVKKKLELAEEKERVLNRDNKREVADLKKTVQS